MYEPKLFNRHIVDKLKAFGVNGAEVICDSANPKDIAEMREYGINAYATHKFPGSVETGLKFLQGLDEIIIDSRRNPAAAKEFSLYEYEQTKDGEYISAYPDKNNHIVDSCRYSLTRLIGKR